MKGQITLCYRKLIDASATKAWDKYVFEDTYMEFFMQAQYYNQQKQFQTFQEILAHNPQAEKLHALVSTAAVGYIQQLQGIMPDIPNAFGKLGLSFEKFSFEIVHSHVSNKQAHKVAIYFYSKPLVWLDTLQDRLLLSYQPADEAGMYATELIALQPYLSITSFQPVTLC